MVICRGFAFKHTVAGGHNKKGYTLCVTYQVPVKYQAKLNLFPTFGYSTNKNF